MLEMVVSYCDYYGNAHLNASTQPKYNQHYSIIFIIYKRKDVELVHNFEKNDVSSIVLQTLGGAAGV